MKLSPPRSHTFQRLNFSTLFKPLKLVMILASLSLILSSKSCGGGGGGGGTTNTTTIHVSVANSWGFSAPNAYTCGSNHGPMLGNNPNINNGSASLYNNTNKRFTEVWVRDITTNLEVSRKLWSNSNGDAGNDVAIDVPSGHPYELYFKQYDACSTVCMYVSTPNGIKGVRLVWTKSQQYNYPTGYVTIAPQCLSDYIVCN
jgi:hypothetical protein